jgi:hypothetical protein
MTWEELRRTMQEKEQRMKKFIVIQESKIVDFDERVNRYLKEGWVVQGGICYADGIYSIAMINLK